MYSIELVNRSDDDQELEAGLFFTGSGKMKQVQYGCMWGMGFMHDVQVKGCCSWKDTS